MTSEGICKWCRRPVYELVSTRWRHSDNDRSACGDGKRVAKPEKSAWASSTERQSTLDGGV